MKAIKLKKQEDKKRVREAFPKGWRKFEVKNGGGYQLKEPYFTIVYTIEMWEMWRKVKDMLKSMEAEGRENEVKKIMLAGTMPEKEVASLYAKLVSEIEGLTLSDYTQIVFQADALRKLEDYDGILFLEKKRASESQFIMKERRLALDRGVKILGTVVLA